MLGEGPGPSESECLTTFAALDITPPSSEQPPSSSVPSSPAILPSPSPSPSSPSSTGKSSSHSLPTTTVQTPFKQNKNNTSTSTSHKKAIKRSQSQSDSNKEYYTQDNTENIDMGLSTLPYDLLLNIATYLDLRDVHSLQLTCRSLYDASTTRPVYRKLANDLLRRCRALPLKGFQRLADLSTESLIHAVNKANHYEAAWRIRAPRPIRSEVLSANGVNSHSNYMDVCSRGGKITVNGRLKRHLEAQAARAMSMSMSRSHPHRSSASASTSISATGTAAVAAGTHRARERRSGWYKIVSAPPGEEVDWLSPITSSYTLCATKSGKVVCWDVQSDTCLAEWNPGARWELWKCRVEFEERTVFFTMAKVLTGSYDDDRVMKFVLMRLTFSDGPSGESSIHPPIFSRVTEFRTTGVVMNVFLLDPSERLLSAFIWVSTSNTIGLYALPDWHKKEYVFIDTGIECVMSSNWSCILYQQHIVIHCEESDAAFQHFYPLALLHNYISTLPNSESSPSISCRVPPARTLKKKFIFPKILPEGEQAEEDEDELEEGEERVEAPVSAGQVAEVTHDITGNSLSSSSSSSASSPTSSSSTSQSSVAVPGLAATTPTPIPAPAPAPQINPNPYPFPPWYPESAHFVRQWWPTLPNIPRVSCTVVLLAAHDQTTHRTRFVLAQHYFRVPLDHKEWEMGEEAFAAAAAKLGGSGGSSSGKSREGGSSLPSASAAAASAGPTSKQSPEGAQDDALMHLWYVSTPFEVVRVLDGPEEDDDGTQAERPRPLVAVDFGHAVWIEYADGDGDVDVARRGGVRMDEDEDEEGDSSSEGDEDEEGVEFGMDIGGTASAATGSAGAGGSGTNNPTNGHTTTNTNGNGRQRINRMPLVDSEPKALRFVTFPPFSEEYGVDIDRRSSSSSKTSQSAFNKNTRESGVQSNSTSNSSGTGSSSSSSGNGGGRGGGSRSTDTNTRVYNASPSARNGHSSVGGGMEGQVRTLEIPDELDLGSVETINIDQSQGAIILSDKSGRIFILCYE